MAISWLARKGSHCADTPVAGDRQARTDAECARVRPVKLAISSPDTVTPTMPRMLSVIPSATHAHVP
ncbi:hypothetical protein ACIBJI_31485 [Nocardia sp. NPDC050408]|jgi:hypothetical protein|uniref:hypothetical protein n=1 Tax=Nocardia sp. NPDC050408 TaxID=3364319 RepID=UPI0037BAA220